MAYHVRKLIREKIKSYLIDIPILKGNVFFDNPDIIQAEDFPCVFIQSNSENVEYKNVSSGIRSQERVYVISVVSYVKSSKNLNDKIDEVDYEVEYALAKNRDVTKLDGLAMFMNLINTDYEFSDDPDSNVGGTRKTYEIRYRTLENKINESI